MFSRLFCPKKSIFLGSYNRDFIDGPKIRGIYTYGEVHTGFLCWKF
nr:MAG TPA: hypothetical protein [Caudoviricetes sp.]